MRHERPLDVLIAPGASWVSYINCCPADPLQSWIDAGFKLFGVVTVIKERTVKKLYLSCPDIIY